MNILIVIAALVCVSAHTVFSCVYVRAQYTGGSFPEYSTDRVWCRGNNVGTMTLTGRSSSGGGARCPCTYSVQHDDGISMAEVVCVGTPFRAQGYSTGSAKATAVCNAKKHCMRSAGGGGYATAAESDGKPFNPGEPRTTISC